MNPRNSTSPSFLASLIPFRNFKEFALVMVLNLQLGLVTFAYGIARALKDTYLLDKGEGSGIIAFTKLIFVVPFMGGLWVFYGFLNRNTTPNGRFYSFCAYFIGFFGLFYAMTYVGLETFEINWLISWEEDAKYARFNQLFLALRYWHLNIFYLHAEAIGTFMLSVSVWTFINSIMTVDLSKRLYSLLSLGAALSTFLAGYVTTRVATNTLILIIISSIATLMLVYYLFQVYRVRYPHQFPQVAVKKKAKKKLTFSESIQVIASSRYLLLIATLVFCYAAFMPLVEALHKDCMRSLGIELGLGGKAGVKRFTGIQLQLIGGFSIFLTFFLAPFVRRLRWFTRAILTPLVLCIFTFIYMGVMFYQSQVKNLVNGTFLDKFLQYLFFDATKSGMFVQGVTKGLTEDGEWVITEFAICVAGGMLLVVVGKSFKYLLFDATKEGAIVPLDEETKTNAKAAIDGVLARMGKSFGAGFVLLAMTVITPGAKSSLGVKNYIVVVCAIVVSCWFLAVIKLSSLYEALTAQQPQEAQKAPKK